MGIDREKQRKARKKWLKTEAGKASRDASRLKYYRKTAYSKNYKKPWTEAEELIVLSHRLTDTEISEKIGRSVASIQMKRTRIKRKLGYTE